ncbi:MAG TPA: Uma2 family endonuclease [Streptosporangiaceae bacterium]
MALLHVPISADIAEARVREVEALWADLDARNLRPEIVHGHLVLKPMPGHRHSSALSRLIKQLAAISLERDWELYTGWHIHIPPIRGDKRVPDLIVGPPAPPKYSENEVYGYGIIMAVEVVSPSSVEDDYGHKPGEYARAGVPLYLILDPLQTPSRVVLLKTPKLVDPIGDAYDYQEDLQVKAGEPLELPEPFGITLDTAALFR